jgi:hypothetical protein
MAGQQRLSQASFRRQEVAVDGARATSLTHLAAVRVNVAWAADSRLRLARVPLRTCVTRIPLVLNFRMPATAAVVATPALKHAQSSAKLGSRHES